MFVIRGKIKDSDEYQYLYTECGFYTFTTYIGQAKFFNSYDECEKVLKSSEFVNETKLTDGTKCPSYALHHLSGVNFRKSTEDVEVSISEINFDDKFREKIHCEIKRPTRTVHYYD